MKTTTYILGSLIAYLVLCVATFLMLQMAIDYSSFKPDIHFLQFKQEYIGIPLWRAAFYTHVFSSVLALAAGLTQFSGHVLKNHRRLHRVVGWIMENYLEQNSKLQLTRVLSKRDVTE